MCSKGSLTVIGTSGDKTPDGKEKTMLPKNVYVVWSFSNKDNTKHYAIAEKISGGHNLLGYAQTYAKGSSISGYARTMSVCNTWKAARQLAHHWNECYKKNGTYSLIME